MSHLPYEPTTSRRAVVLAALLSLASTFPALAQAHPAVERFTAGSVEVTVTREPEKRLDFVEVVPASLDRVWQAMTTKEGLITWLTPGATVELRLGGLWQGEFPGGKTAGGNILAFIPKQMLAVSAMAPESFPTVRRERTQAVFFFDSIDATHTRVRLAQIGWKSGEEWDRAFDYLAKGNAQLLTSLQASFVNGPIDWQAMFGKPKS